MTLVSIIVPVYRVEMYIYDCISSVLSQSYPAIELILVDDATDDKSMDIARKTIENYQQNNCIKFVFLHHDHNLGLSAARNTGIKAATGDYLFFLDADDELFTNCIELLVSAIEVNNTDMAMGENLIADGSRERYVSLGFSENVVRGNSLVLEYYLQQKWYNVAWNKLVKKKFIKRNLLYFKDGYIYEDELWGFMLATKLTSVAVVKQPLYRYKIRPNSIMQSGRESNRWMSMLRLMPFFKSYISEAGLQGNNRVEKFYMLKLIQITNQLYSLKKLNYKIFNGIYLLRGQSPIKMKQAGEISTKECIAYLWLQLPFTYISYFYFLTIQTYYFFRKITSKHHSFLRKNVPLA